MASSAEMHAGLERNVGESNFIHLPTYPVV